MKQTRSRFPQLALPLATYHSLLAAARRLTPAARRAALAALLITLHASLVTLPGCGDDKKSDGGASKDELRTRLWAAQTVLEEKRCSVASACYAKEFATYPGHGSVENCTKVNLEQIQVALQIIKGASFEQDCYLDPVPAAEACATSVAAADARSFCGSLVKETLRWNFLAVSDCAPMVLNRKEGCDTPVLAPKRGMQ
ncbi:MAG: hypothetical protein HYT87_00005 [Nitrospirae bacterium]|nr:hypothetical protein [Nitrospirota bacterium]